MKICVKTSGCELMGMLLRASPLDTREGARGVTVRRGGGSYVSDLETEGHNFDT